MKPEVIVSDKAPKAMGAYAQAVRANGFVFLSGQIPLDPATGELVQGDVGTQARRVMDNLKAVLELPDRHERLRRGEPDLRRVFPGCEARTRDDRRRWAATWIES
jgi:Endoribonuclease L-PSP